MERAREILNELNALVNGPVIGRQTRDRLTQLWEQHGLLKVPSEQFEQTVLEIPVYAGSNSNVCGLMSALRPHSCVGVHMVILQGSLATGEEIAYSDFDALVVLRDTTFSDPRKLLATIVRLQQLSRFISLQDPLQHHGWFVTTEKLLQHHYDDFFPVEIFRHAAAVFPASDVLRLKLSVVRDPAAYRYQLNSTVNAIVKELNSGQYLNNLYEFKSALSKFMLLPALYVQCRDSLGVYKKDSFTLAKRDFSAAAWQIMDEVSQRRIQWQQEMAEWRRWLILLHPSWTRKMSKRLAPALPKELYREAVVKSSKMLTFANLIQERVKAIDGEK